MIVRTFGGHENASRGQQVSLFFIKAQKQGILAALATRID
jgi:hypothetical protein